MHSFAVGPLALPVLPFALLMAALLSSYAASWLGRRQGLSIETADRLGNSIYLSLAIGLLISRATHVGQNWDEYAASPIAMLDLRDGGWHLNAGVYATALMVCLTIARQFSQGRRLAGTVLILASSLGAGLWLAALIWTCQAQDRLMPEIALSRLDGQTLSLQQHSQGQASVINLWASWCGPCRAEMPVFIQTQREHPDIRFLYANQGETAEAVHGFLRQHPLDPKHILLDRGSDLGRAIGSSSLPTTLFYRPDGRLHAIHVGPLNRAALRAQLRALRLAAQTPAYRQPS